MSYRTLAEALLSGRPYFGPALCAMQGVPARHQYFLPVVIDVGRRREGLHMDVLEIGSWAGASTISWAMSLREVGAAGTVTCVDPWLPYFEAAEEHASHYRDMNSAARDGLIARLFEHNIRCAGVADMIRQRGGYSRDVLPELPSGQFDIVYIDGSHRFEDVCVDIQQAKRLLRGEGVICGDDLEIEASSLPADESARAIESGRDYISSETYGCYYHPGVTGAVAQEFQTVGLWEGFWAARHRDGEWTGPDLDLNSMRLPAHINQRQGQALLLESTETHNLVGSDGRYFAIHKSLGPVELFQERLGDRELAPLLLTGATLDEVRGKVLDAAPSAASHPEPEVPVLAGSYGLFNLVTYQGRTFALRMSLGPVNVAEGEDALRQRFGPEDFTVAADHTTARRFIDQIELVQKGAAMSAELARNVEDLREEVRSLRTSATAEIESHSRDISSLHTAVNTAPQGLDRMVESLGAETLAREKQCAELRDLLQALRQELVTDWAELRDAVLASTASIRQLEQDVRNRVGSSADELAATVEAVARKQDLLRHEVTLMQYGPGNPDTICPAGEYLGFQFAYYRGHLYALRKPLDLDLISRGEQELLAAYGPDDVIVGHTLDGVHARIEICEGLREVRIGIAAVNGEFLAARGEMSEELKQLDSVVRAHTHHLEKLSRRWPNRLFHN